MKRPEQHIRMPASVGRRAPRRNPERSIQCAIVDGLRAGLPRGWIVEALRNNPRSKVSGAIEKSMGARAGLPDIMILGTVSQGDYAGPDDARVWFLEVKGPKGRVHFDQRVWHSDAKGIGHQVVVVRSLDAAFAAGRSWGWPLRIAA